MISSPLVSIVTPVYNAEDFLNECLRSVSSQTYQNWEMLVVIDSKSNDRSKQIATLWHNQDPRIHIISNENCTGVGPNRNEGLKVARGNYIAFIDADDIWCPEKLLTQISFMTSSNYSFTYHWFERIDEAGKSLGIIKPPRSLNYKGILANGGIAGCLTVIIKKSLVLKHKFSNEGHEDYRLWLDILKDDGHAYCLPQVLGRYRVRKSSRSGNKFSAALWRWQIFRTKEKLSLAKSIYFFFMYAYTAVAARLVSRFKSK